MIATVATLPLAPDPALDVLTAGIVARFRAHLAEPHEPELDEEPVYHPTTRDPREVGGPMKLNPPKQPKPREPKKPKPQQAEAGIVLGWLFATTCLHPTRSPMTLRGKVAVLKPLGA